MQNSIFTMKIKRLYDRFIKKFVNSLMFFIILKNSSYKLINSRTINKLLSIKKDKSDFEVYDILYHPITNI